MIPASNFPKILLMLLILALAGMAMALKNGGVRRRFEGLEKEAVMLLMRCVSWCACCGSI